MIKHQVLLRLEIDPEEFPIPADNDTASLLEEVLRDVLYDQEGVTVKKIKIT